MSAGPRRSTRHSRTAAAEPAAAASSAAAGSKRPASHDDAPSAVKHQQLSASPMDDTAPATAESSSVPSATAPVSDRQSVAASASFAAHSHNAAATRKKQKLAQSAAAAAPAVVAPPWSRLYSDALHSVFKFATLADLTRLMSVSRRWGEAVMTMPPVAVPAFISSAARVDGLFGSRVRRHVTSLLHRGMWQDESLRLSRLSAAQLQRASAQVPWLSELAVEVSSVDVEMVSDALTRFTKLRRLDMDLHRSMPAAGCNRIILTIGALNPARINSLTLNLEFVWPADHVSFAPLSALAQLRFFSFNFLERLSRLTDAQIRHLRALTSLHQLTTPNLEEDETEFLVRMLQPGHALQWTTLGWDERPTDISATLAAVLGSLPTLTLLRAVMDCADVQFFAQLTRLTDLEVDGNDWPVGPSALVSSLRHCTQLTRLKLENFALSGGHLEELLPAFPLLSDVSLMFMHNCRALRCFATPALAASLTSLQLNHLPRCPPSELCHLLGLCSLRSISVKELSSPVTAADQSAFHIPSAHFPALQDSDVLNF